MFETLIQVAYVLFGIDFSDFDFTSQEAVVPDPEAGAEIPDPEPNAGAVMIEGG